MARKDALLRIYKRLAARREVLQTLLSTGASTDQVDVGDLGDVASESERKEMRSHLASIESRELQSVERAMEMIRDGEYGMCEACTKPIPVARLNALPFSVRCVDCQRGDDEIVRERGGEMNWEQACDYECRFSEQEFTLKDFDVER
jgi:DnaK suppressor protein